MGNSRRHGLVEFEPNFYVAAIKVELGNLVLFQELDQLLQILDIFWFHSFLLPSTLRARWKQCKMPISKFNEGLGRRREHFGAGSRYGHHVFDANTELPLQVDSRLYGDHHAGNQPCRL